MSEVKENKELFALKGQLYSGTFRSRKDHKTKNTPALNEDYKNFTESYLKQRLMAFGDIADKLMINGIPAFYVNGEAAPTSFEILYSDLEGNPYTYTDPNGDQKTYTRKRFVPGLEDMDKEGNPYKYKTPKGAPVYPYLNGLFLFFKDRLAEIETLYIVEGEFKALAGCMANIPIIGISGIHNFGKTEKNDFGKTIDCNFLPEIQSIFRKITNLKTIVLLHDSDSGQCGETPGKREISFYSSVSNFKLASGHFSFKTFFSKIKVGLSAKGLDDLLFDYPEDWDAIRNNALSLKSNSWFEFINLNKISEKKLREYFRITEEFNNTFRKDKINKKNIEQREEAKRKLAETEYIFNAYEHQFWLYTEKRLEFRYVEAINFLQANGFFKVFMKTQNDNIFVKIYNKIIEELSHEQIRDFINAFVKTLEDKSVLELIFKGGSQYFGPKVLSNLENVEVNQHKSTKHEHFLYFKNFAWKITKDKIEEVEYKSLDGLVWDNKIIDFSPSLIQEDIFKIDSDSDGKFTLELESDKQIDYLEYLWNTSRLYWREEEQGVINAKQKEEQILAFINKVTATGWLLNRNFDPSNAFAVICLDSQLSEVGQSNGGTGKSLFGKAIKELSNTFMIDGKRSKLFDNDFLFHGVDERTQIVFFDDVRMSFDFQSIYNHITGAFTVNPKKLAPYTIPSEATPKIIISSNHQIRENGASDARRKWTVPFGDYYHTKRTPSGEMGRNMFDSKWPDEQRNYFINIMARCIQAYLKFGKVESALENLRLRQLRQQMGETFLDWANVYFTIDVPEEQKDKIKIQEYGDKSRKLTKTEMYDSFLLTIHNPQERNIYNNRMFKQCLRYFCEYKGLIFNGGQPDDYGNEHGGQITSNSKEYIRIWFPNDLPF